MLQLEWPENRRYGPLVYVGDGAHRLWQYRGRAPQSPESILIYDNGVVLQQAHPTQVQIDDEAVHTFILGGWDYRTEPGSFAHTALTAHGYSFREV